VLLEIEDEGLLLVTDVAIVFLLLWLVETTPVLLLLELTTEDVDLTLLEDLIVEPPIEVAALLLVLCVETVALVLPEELAIVDLPLERGAKFVLPMSTSEAELVPRLVV